MCKTSVAAALLLAACGGGSKPKAVATTPPPEDLTRSQATPSTEPSTTTPQDDVSQRKRLKVTLPSELQWKPMVAELGDKGPQWVVLWGEPDTGPNGFFIKDPAGDKGALHSHTHDYHAVAISGPNAGAQDGSKVTPIAAGTYWYQPGGAAHINACPGTEACVALVHYNDGKRDFAPAQPKKGAKKDPRFVEKPLKDIKWTPFDPKDPTGAAFAVLWGDHKAGPNGMLFKLPPGNAPFWHWHKHDYHGVVLDGTVQHYESGTAGKDLPVGTYWWQPGGNKHVDLCKTAGSSGGCVIYTYFENAFDVTGA